MEIQSKNPPPLNLLQSDKLKDFFQKSSDSRILYHILYNPSSHSRFIMIEETIKIHDKFQFELKSYYPLDPKQRKTSYTIDHYFFFPDSIDINRQTFPKYLFYRHIKTYIRFKTPTFLLKNIARKEVSPLKTLREEFDKLVLRQDSETVMNYENQNKMFCSIVKSAMRDHIELVNEKKDPVDIDDLVNKYLSGIDKILSNFRKLRSIINIPVISEKLFTIYLISDEYLSILTERYTYELLEVLQKKNPVHFQNHKSTLLKLVREEVDYRKDKKYPSIPMENDDNEALVFRRNVFKRYLGSILFLDTSQQPDAKILRQTIASLAAGIAMIFATGIAFMSQQKYGNFTLSFFFALVVGYMFKDRIKELTRDYFSEKILSLFFDHKTDIYSGTKKNYIGFCKEKSYFILENKVDSEIIKVRKRDAITEIGNDYFGEQLMLYRKKIQFHSQAIMKDYQNYGIKGINDISIFNVDEFIQKMDDPQKKLYCTDGKDYWKIRGRKVYHINLVIKFSSQKFNFYKHFRIILNRRGIKRIEEIKGL